MGLAEDFFSVKFVQTRPEIKIKSWKEKYIYKILQT